MSMIEKCGTCKFWDKYGVVEGNIDGEAAGHCRVGPPVWTASKSEDPYNPGFWSQPMVWEDKWCGQWKMKDGGF